MALESLAVGRRDPRRRRVLPQSEAALNVFYPVSEAPPGDKSAGEGDIGEVDRERINTAMRSSRRRSRRRL